MKHRTWVRGLVLAVAMVLLVATAPVLIVAQNEPPSTPITASSYGTASPGPLRTREQMAQMQVPAGSSESIPFMPTVSPGEYAAMKAASVSGPERPGVPGGSQIRATPPNTGGFEGLDAGSCCLRPPDTHGAVGPTQFVEVVNSNIRIFTKAGVVLNTISLQAFFGSIEFLFDPRVVFDPHWNRWVILATRRATSPADPSRRFVIAASTSADATGPFFVYTFTFTGSNGDWWDYPGLGFDQDAIIVTANLFRCVAGTCGTGQNVIINGRITPIAKARLYNGFGFTVPIFAVTPGPQPPLVLDQNAIAVVARVAGSPNVQLYRLSSGSNPTQATLAGPFTVNVGTYVTPPVNAVQPGGQLLDTLDGRFQNASTQVGDVIYQIDTTNFNTAGGPRPTPTVHKMNWATNVNVFTQSLFRSALSYDFSPSIAASGADRVVATWTATDPSSSVNAEIRAAGKDVGNFFFPSLSGLALSGGGSAAAYNPTADNPERWGDYSAVTVDPANAKRFWVVNEKINSSTIWGSRIGHFTFP